MRTIALSNSDILVKVDDDIYEIYKDYPWCVLYAHGVPKYAQCYELGPMHRVIMKPPLGLEIDHIDNDGFNNQRENLRIVTPSQNMQAAPKIPGQSGFIGVTKNKRRWSAKLKVDTKRIHIGTFDTPEEAALARDKVARELHGKFAILNFPDIGESK